MNLFNRKRYFIVFYAAVDKYGRMRIGDFYLTSTGKFFSRQNVIEKIKEINNEFSEVVITGIKRLSKSEYKIWVG